MPLLIRTRKISAYSIFCFSPVFAINNRTLIFILSLFRCSLHFTFFHLYDSSHKATIRHKIGFQTGVAVKCHLSTVGNIVMVFGFDACRFSSFVVYHWASHPQAAAVRLQNLTSPKHIDNCAVARLLSVRKSTA